MLLIPLIQIKSKSFGYQVGLRVESSNYKVIYLIRNQDFKTNFPVSLFPSFFLSDKMKNDQELQIELYKKDQSAQLLSSYILSLIIQIH